MASGDNGSYAQVAKDVGYAELATDSTTYGDTESGSLMSVTCNLISGVKYDILLVANVGVDVANDGSILRVRDNSATGTQLIGPQRFVGSTSSVGEGVVGKARYTAAATGSRTFHVTGDRNSGTGTAHRIRAGAGRVTSLTVTRVVEP